MPSFFHRFLAVIAVLVSTIQLAQAQSRRSGQWCATDANAAALRASFHEPALEAQRAAAEELAARMQANDALAGALNPPASRIVPTVIHVVTPCGTTTITKQQILNKFGVMVQDWQRLNPDTTATRAVFRPYASTIDIEFRLAQLDPQGNPTDGIVRETSSAQSTAAGYDPMKAEVPAWPNCFNIWLVPTIDGGGLGSLILGYGQFPGTGPWTTWGFVMRTDCWTGAFGPNDRTASHEVGHCFNLIHSFTDAGGCGSGNCVGDGDRVCDTPPQASATQSCNRSQNSCATDVGSGSPYTTNVVDQIENYMSYDDCQNMFTRGQKTRVDAALQSISYLQNLVSPANQLLMGVANGQTVPPAGPVAYISTCQLNQVGGRYVACQGRPVTFSDASYNAPIVSRRWTFSNATPATSTAAILTVVFNTPGMQTVTLVATGTGGAISAPITLIVQVLPIGALVAPFQESFETAGIDTIFQSSSSSSSATARKWRLVTSAVVAGLVASDGQAAFQLQNGNITQGTVSTLTSPPFDTRNLASVPRPHVKFDVAYARRNLTSADELRVYLSVDCGRTWQQRYTKSGAALVTNGTQLIANFTPTAAGQWRTDSVALLGQFLNQRGVMVKFEGTSQTNGNNLYIDNLRVNGQLLVGLAADLSSAGIVLAPNPLAEETTLRLTLARPTRVAVRISDVLGRAVLADDEQTLPVGTHESRLGQRLSYSRAGVYVVTITLDGQPYTQKLLVQ